MILQHTIETHLMNHYTRKYKSDEETKKCIQALLYAGVSAGR